MNKCHTPIGFHNNTTPALNETNLNYLDGCVDTIDDRVVAIANDPPANALKAEGWAIGEQSGVPVTSDSPYYENNSKYYSQESANEVLKSEGYANGTQGGVPVTSGSPYYENNAKYWKEQAQAIASSSLSGLSDVSITNPQDGDLLAYDADNNEWVNSSETNDRIAALYSMTGGKNINSYPYSDTTKSANGVTWIDRGDGTIHATGGTSSTYSRFELHSSSARIFIPNGTYIYSGCPNGGGDSTYSMFLSYTKGGSTIGVVCTGAEVQFTIDGSDGDATGASVRMGLDVERNVTLPTGGITFKPMIRDASIADDTYVSYAKTNRELTQEQVKNTDLTSIIATGSTNTTGAQIPNGAYFYLNGVFCRAIASIATNATFTKNTNYVETSVADAINQQTATVTYNGLTANFDRAGKVAHVAITSGSTTSSISENGIVVSFPQGFYPKVNGQGKFIYGSSNRYSVSANVNAIVALDSAISSGTLLRLDYVYITT